ncbi:MAG: calcium-binding protein [Geitlerinemataceae cyanobacterium]
MIAQTTEVDGTTFIGGNGDDSIDDPNGIGGLLSDRKFPSSLDGGGDPLANDDDLLVGDAGNDTLNGFSGDDILLGGQDDDDLLGWTGNDTLVGGVGQDYLTGWEGRDTFVLSPGEILHSSFDVFKDFDPDPNGDFIGLAYGLERTDLSFTAVESYEFDGETYAVASVVVSAFGSDIAVLEGVSLVEVNNPALYQTVNLPNFIEL